MSDDRKAELAAIEQFVARMKEADQLASKVELRHQNIVRARETRPDLRRSVEPARAKARELAEPASAVATPPAVERARLFQKVGRWANADWYELLLPPRGRVKVPDGCLITGGDRAWRREESW